MGGAPSNFIPSLLGHNIDQSFLREGEGNDPESPLHLISILQFAESQAAPQI